MIFLAIKGTPSRRPSFANGPIGFPIGQAEERFQRLENRLARLRVEVDEERNARAELVAANKQLAKGLVECRQKLEILENFKCRLSEWGKRPKKRKLSHDQE